MIRWNRVRGLAAAAAMAVTISFSSFGLAALAATGTVKGDSVNVRSDASTSSSIVGTANNGDSFDLGESKDDDSGATWYQVTLSDGSTGYIRSDFLNIADDDAADGDSAADGSSDGSTAADSDSSEASTDTTSTDTGDYQIVLAPDENGNNTYYLYNNKAQERMKLSDIESLQQQVTQAQAQVSSVRSQYRVILIVLAILLVVAIAAAIALFVRLRDALSSGRSHERDLTQERKDMRRSGNTRADDVNSLRRPQNRPQTAARRNEPYPSGTRRVAEGSNGAGARPVRPAAGTRPQQDTRAAARPSQPQQGGRESGQTQPGRRPEAQGQQARRPEAAARRPDSPEAAARRPMPNGQAAGAQQPQGRPSGAAPSQSPKPARKPQPKNFADDDDLDYDFISLDDTPRK